MGIWDYRIISAGLHRLREREGGREGERERARDIYIYIHIIYRIFRPLINDEPDLIYHFFCVLTY